MHVRSVIVYGHFLICCCNIPGQSYIWPIWKCYSLFSIWTDSNWLWKMS